MKVLLIVSTFASAFSLIERQKDIIDLWRATVISHQNGQQQRIKDNPEHGKELNGGIMVKAKRETQTMSNSDVITQMSRNSCVHPYEHHREKVFLSIVWMFLCLHLRGWSQSGSSEYQSYSCCLSNWMDLAWWHDNDFILVEYYSIVHLVIVGGFKEIVRVSSFLLFLQLEYRKDQMKCSGICVSMGIMNWVMWYYNPCMYCAWLWRMNDLHFLHSELKGCSVTRVFF